jgi:hypothetical protein
MSGFNSFNTQKKASRSSLWQKRQELGDPLFIGRIGHFRQRVQTLRHTGKGEELVATVIMEGLLAKRVARK